MHVPKIRVYALENNERIGGEQKGRYGYLLKKPQKGPCQKIGRKAKDK